MTSNVPDAEKAQSTLAVTESLGVNNSIDPAEERKLLAKLDAAFVPVIMLVYLTCFLDRTVIGNVKVAGMPEDIGASPEQFSTAVSIFYATYVLAETPWSILLKKLTPRVLLTSLCVVWSLTTIFSGFITSPGGLYAARLVLGACEGGLFPSLNIYLTMVYRRNEMAKRVAYLFACTALSGAVGGLLAYAILHMDGVGGYAGWRWVYIIEGLGSSLVGFATWFGLPTDPIDCWTLSPSDRELMKIRAVQRAAYMGSEEFSWTEIKLAAIDPKIWISGCIQFCQDVLLYGFSTFLPSIIESLGHTSLQAQYLSIPVYITGGLCFLLTASVSDRTSLRGPFLIFTNMFGIIGYILILCKTSYGVKFFGTFFCAIAVYNGPGLNLAWLNVNVAPQLRRATAIGLQQTFGNTAGIVAGQVYRKSPYVVGNAFSLGALGVSQLLIAGKWMYLRRCNEVKAKIRRGEVNDSRDVRTGDRKDDFVYHL